MRCGGELLGDAALLVGDDALDTVGRCCREEEGSSGCCSPATAVATPFRGGSPPASPGTAAGWSWWATSAPWPRWRRRRSTAQPKGRRPSRWLGWTSRPAMRRPSAPRRGRRGTARRPGELLLLRGFSTKGGQTKRRERTCMGMNCCWLCKIPIHPSTPRMDITIKCLQLQRDSSSSSR